MDALSYFSPLVVLAILLLVTYLKNQTQKMDTKAFTMDTKTLVVGQKVSMTKSGVYGNWGEVVDVSPSGVAVKTEDGELLRFDKKGKQTDANRRDTLCFGPSPESKFHTVLWFCAPEFEPWEIDETYFPKRGPQ